MSKAVLISIQPKWCSLILSGEKTVEVRKTRPKIKTPFKCYIYCTKDYSLGEFYTSQDTFAIPVQGKIIGEFVCKHITDIMLFGFDDITEFEKQTCLDAADIVRYLKGFYGFGWHISDLVIYNKPKELSEFEHTKEYVDNIRNSVVHWECGVDDECVRPLRKPPQSWCYVEERGGR